MERQLLETEGSNYSTDEYQRSSSSRSGDHDQKDNSNIHWTDEKHLHFLRFMEDAFVKSMFQNNNNNNKGNASRCRRGDRRDHLRLDRYVPDSSESTLDGKREIVKRKKNISHCSTDEADSSTVAIDKLDPRRSSSRRQRRRLAATVDRYSIPSRDPVAPAVGKG